MCEARLRATRHSCCRRVRTLGSLTSPFVKRLQTGERVGVLLAEVLRDQDSVTCGILKRGTLDFRAKSAGSLFAETWAKLPLTSITY
jgi:hypothetical protein